MSYLDFFKNHQIQHTACLLGLKPSQVGKVVDYMVSLGSFSQTDADRTLKMATSEDIKKLVKVLERKELELGEQEDGEKLDPMELSHHDYRPITTHSTENEPATTGYSLFSLQVAQQTPP